MISLQYRSARARRADGKVSPPCPRIDGMEGKRIQGPRATQFLLDSLEPRVPRPVQLEAAGFHIRRRVAVVSRESDRLHAVVRAGRPHDVTVTIAPSGKIGVGCDCVPFLAEPFVCRHVYATLIKVVNEDLLRQPPATAAAP